MSLGKSLKSARENARLSLDDLTAMTSIRAGLIAQMENDDFSGCGGDIYARGHLRTLATRLNLDVEEVLAQYANQHEGEQRRIQDLLKEHSVTPEAPSTRRISYKALSLVSVSILALAALVQVVISNSDSSSSQTTRVASPSPTPSATPTQTPSPTASASASSSPANAVNTLTLTAARGNASVDIVTKEGHVYKGWLLQGESKEVSAESRISIYVSNAGDVDVVFNGTPVGSLGAPNQEIRRTFG